MTKEEFKKELELLNEKVINFKDHEHKQGKVPTAFGKIERQPKTIPSKKLEHKRRLRYESLTRR